MPPTRGRPQPANQAAQPGSRPPHRYRDRAHRLFSRAPADPARGSAGAVAGSWARFPGAARPSEPRPARHGLRHRRRRRHQPETVTVNDLVYTRTAEGGSCTKAAAQSCASHPTRLPNPTACGRPSPFPACEPVRRPPRVHRAGTVVSRYFLHRSLVDRLPLWGQVPTEHVSLGPEASRDVATVVLLVLARSVRPLVHFCLDDRAQIGLGQVTTFHFCGTRAGDRSCDALALGGSRPRWPLGGASAFSTAVQRRAESGDGDAVSNLESCRQLATQVGTHVSGR